MGTTTGTNGIEHSGDGGQLPVIALSPKQAAKAVGISQRTLHTKTMDGTLPSFKLGRRRLYSLSALTAAIEKLQGGAE